MSRHPGSVPVGITLSAAEPTYVKKATRHETILASLAASGFPTLQGKWYIIGPFDNSDNLGFDTPYPHSLEWAYFPGPIRIGEALKKVMRDA